MRNRNTLYSAKEGGYWTPAIADWQQVDCDDGLLRSRTCIFIREEQFDNSEAVGSEGNRHSDGSHRALTTTADCVHSEKSFTSSVVHYVNVLEGECRGRPSSRSYPHSRDCALLEFALSQLHNLHFWAVPLMAEFSDGTCMSRTLCPAVTVRTPHFPPVRPALIRRRE